MHDKPGVIIVDLTLPIDDLERELDDAYEQAEFAWHTEKIAVFTHGYSGK
jgi:hypothetical protein